MQSRRFNILITGKPVSTSEEGGVSFEFSLLKAEADAPNQLPPLREKNLKVLLVSISWSLSLDLSQLFGGQYGLDVILGGLHHAPNS